MKLEPIVVKDVPHLNPSGPGVQLVDMYVQPPHETFAAYYSENRLLFNEWLLGGENAGHSLEEYWGHMADTPHFQSWEFADEIFHNPTSWIPLRMWVTMSPSQQISL